MPPNTDKKPNPNKGGKNNNPPSEPPTELSTEPTWGSDVIIGSGTITGIPATGDLSNGENNQQDVLTGGNGPDTFVLGDSRGVFYANDGVNDFAVITNFDPKKDSIQLHENASYIGGASLDLEDADGDGVTNEWVYELYYTGPGANNFSTLDGMAYIFSADGSTISTIADNVVLA
jgi:hypothetical protein